MFDESHKILSVYLLEQLWLLQLSLPSFCFSFTAELIALYEALKYIYSSNNKYLITYSDLMSVLESLKLDYSTHSSLSHYATAETTFTSWLPYAFCWVSSHEGIQGNES